MVLAKHFLLATLSLVMAKAAGQTFDIEMSDKPGNDENTIKMQEEGDVLMNNIRTNEGDELKGFDGTIGIVGGSAEFVGAAYLAGMTALKLGVDSVKLLCDAETAETMKSIGQDISIYPILDKIELTVKTLETVDVIILGPGLERTGNNRDSVIPKILNMCKTFKKPLVIDLDIWFWTKDLVNALARFRESGVILIVGQKDFKRVYQEIKKASASTEIELDNRFANIYVLRTGNMDRGISTNKKVSWTSQIESYMKPGSNQDFILTGAVGAFYFWANKHLTVARAKIMGPMYQAGVATFTASTVVRKISREMSQTKGIFMIASDIVDDIERQYFEIDGLSEDQ